jgi:hypothetical protein
MGCSVTSMSLSERGLRERLRTFNTPAPNFTQNSEPMRISLWLAVASSRAAEFAKAEPVTLHPAQPFGIDILACSSSLFVFRVTILLPKQSFLGAGTI